MGYKKRVAVTLNYHTFEEVDRIKMLWHFQKGSSEKYGCSWLVKRENDTWRGECDFPVQDKALSAFYFEVWRGEEMIDTEPCYCHFAGISNCVGADIACRWITNRDENNYRYTSAFICCIYSPAPVMVYKTKQPQVCFIVQDFVCPKGYELYLVGNEPCLGAWDVSKAVRMNRAGFYSYYADCPAMAYPLQYKYVLKEEATGNVIWEEGANRYLAAQPCCSSGMLPVVEDTALALPQYTDKLAGIVVPVFSLRSKKSWGVGDFGDLRKMIIWAHSVGLNVLQVLPVNDTTRSGGWEESYPYNSISIFALHPMYADLNVLGSLKDKRAQRRFEVRRKELNNLLQVDYEAVNKLKNDFLQTYYEEHKNEIKVDMTFYEGLMKPYIYFRVLQDVYRTADFRTWPVHGRYDETVLDLWMKQEGHEDKVRYYAWVQQLLVDQLESVHDFARKSQVILKGDMPIGVSRDSATAWYYPQYFHFDGQAGAPPDFFSEKGQNWGFPTYNWKNILNDDGIWWRQRLQFMSRFFDAYRIDHVLGFFRIWQIPYGTSDGRLGYFLPDLPMTEDEIRNYGFMESMQVCVTADNEEPWNVLFIPDKVEPGLFHPAVSGQSTTHYKQLTDADRYAYDRIHNDYFYCRHNDFWAREGLKRLPCAVYSTRMLVCAEDLGMVPDCVHGILERFRILSLEVEGMPKRNEGRFSWVPNNPYRSVDTITTHDMEPLRLWWSRHHEDAQSYYEQRMDGHGEAPKDLSPLMVQDIIRRHMDSPSLLCIVALQDWLAMDAALRNPDMAIEQINDPANPHHYWRYRMHLDIEELQAADAFCHMVEELANRSRLGK